VLNVVSIECEMGWSGRGQPVWETKGKCSDIRYWHSTGSAWNSTWIPLQNYWGTVYFWIGKYWPNSWRCAKSRVVFHMRIQQKFISCTDGSIRVIQKIWSLDFFHGATFHYVTPSVKLFLIIEMINIYGLLLADKIFTIQAYIYTMDIQRELQYKPCKWLYFPLQWINSI